jgi:chitinase
MRFPGDRWEDTSAIGKDVHGIVKQLYLLKKKHHSLKIMLSIGGWTYSPKINGILKSEAKREMFARTAVDLMTNYGFDGINVDWEHIEASDESTQMVSLLKDIRKGIDDYAEKTNSAPFLLSVACDANPQHYKIMDIQGMDKYLDFWDFMAYDYSGSFEKTAGHMSNLFPDSKNPTTTPFNTEAAMDFYLNVGKVNPSKINLGLPLYGRSFVQTQGPGTAIDQQQSAHFGAAGDGTFQYKELPLPGSRVVELPDIGASYMYNADEEFMITYDTPNIARQKAKWIKEKGLGGAMYWDVACDKKGNDSIVATVIQELGQLEKSKNHLWYPDSEWANIKNGMMGEGEEVHAEDEGKDIYEPLRPALQGADESKEIKIEVGVPTPTSASFSTPEPSIAEVVIVAESTQTATATTVSTSSSSAFYSVYGAGPRLTITQSEPFSTDTVEAEDEDENQEKEIEEEKPDGKKYQEASSYSSTTAFPTSKTGAKKSVSSASLVPTASQVGAIVTGTILIFLF